MGLYQTKFWFRNTFGRLTKYFIKINPDHLSYLAVFVSAVTGFTIYYSTSNPNLLLVSFGLIILRMILNTFDGMIAIAQGKKTMVGEVVNALPDRYSDVFVLLGLVLCKSTNPLVGSVAMASVLLVSYSGMLGKAMGVNWQHQGPVGKVDRLVAILIVLIMQYLMSIYGVDINNILGFEVGLFDCLLIWFIAGSQLTIYKRVKSLVDEIKLAENLVTLNSKMPSQPKGIIVYDSSTGNTKKIAEAIASSTRFDIVHVNDAPLNLSKYKVLVLGSANIRANPSQKILEFIDKVVLPEKYAFFVTYGMPLWGQISTFSLLRKIKKSFNKKGCKNSGTFQCPGFHTKYKTYKKSPCLKDVNNAKKFGLSLVTN